MKNYENWVLLATSLIIMDLLCIPFVININVQIISLINDQSSCCEFFVRKVDDNRCFRACGIFTNTSQEMANDQLIHSLVITSKFWKTQGNSDLHWVGNLQENKHLPVVNLVGWIGGWAWSDLFPFLGFGPHSSTRFAKFPHAWCGTCCSTNDLKYNSSFL